MKILASRIKPALGGHIYQGMVHIIPVNNLFYLLFSHTNNASIIVVFTVIFI